MLGLGLASSHAPGMWRAPEEWPRIVDRMSPEVRGHLPHSAKVEIETLEIRQEHYRRIHAAFGVLRAQLEAYVRMESARTGLRRFPLGTGEASLRKAPTVVRWDERGPMALGWVTDLVMDHPEIVNEVSRRRLLNFVRWTEPRADGISEAVDPRTGEVLEGLWRDARLGQFTVSLGMDEEKETTE